MTINAKAQGPAASQSPSPASHHHPYRIPAAHRTRTLPRLHQHGSHCRGTPWRNTLPLAPHPEPNHAHPACLQEAEGRKDTRHGKAHNSAAKPGQGLHSEGPKQRTWTRMRGHANNSCRRGIHIPSTRRVRVQCSYTGRNSPPLVAILAASVADAVGHVVRTVRAEMPFALARVADARVMLARRAHVLDVAVAWVRHGPAQQGVSNHREHSEHR